MDGFVFIDAGGTQIKSAAYSGTGERLCDIHSVPSLSAESRDTVLGNFISVIEKEKQVLLSAGFSRIRGKEIHLTAERKETR